MPRCSAASCRNMGSHTFPKDPYLRSQWEKATNKPNFKASKHSRLCYDHFTPSDYVDVCLSTGISPFHRYLKKTAVPSIFSSKIQQSTSHASVIETKTATPPKKNNDLKINAVSPQNAPKKEESNNSEINTVLRNRSMRLKNRKAYLLNRRCSVPHCNTRPSNEISLHPCPNNAAVRNEWAEALRVSFQYVKNMVACSLHFTKLDFIQSKNSERVLKHSAVPSRNLPTRKKGVVPAKKKLVRKEDTFLINERPQTMTETAGETKDVEQEEVIRECRTCLKRLDDKKSCCYVFQSWAPPWDGMEATIAEDLAKLANVEVSITDKHSKVLCVACYQRLLDAATFSAKVRSCDLILRMRFSAETDMAKVWPKPIQVDKNINGSVFTNPMDVEIKQEMVSDEEYPMNGTDNSYVDSELGNLDIKIEPEELAEPPPLNITINGTISLDPLNSENKDVQKNETELQQESHLTEVEVKQEPTSEGEQEIELTPDLSLECLLCAKAFHSVTGLKAHVIAQHSYKTVKRKADGIMSPEKKRRDKHVCAICKRSFQTSTDLMVHETCHNKHSCYGCTQKFDTFELLTRHRKRCKATIGNSVQKLKTLEDVKRPLPEQKVGNLEWYIEKTETETTSKVGEDIEMKESETIKDVDVEMKDFNSEQKEETSEQNQLNSKAQNYEKPESVNEEVENDKQLETIIPAPELVHLVESESTIQEPQVDQHMESENIKQELDIVMEAESIKQEVGVVMESESIVQEQEVTNVLESESIIIQEQELVNVMESESKIQEVENVLECESVKEEQELDNVLESESIMQEKEPGNVLDSESKIQEVDECRTSFVISEPITFIESESVIEEVDDDKQLLGEIEVDNDEKSEIVVEGVDSDKKTETIVAEVPHDKNLGSVFEAEDVILESLIQEEETVTIKAESEKEELITDKKKVESENIEIEEDADRNLELNLALHSTQNETESAVSDADMPVETLDDDNCI